MFNHTPLAVFLYSSVSFQRNLAVLNIQLLQPSAVIRYALHPSISNQITIPQTQLLQVRTALGQRPQAGVTNIALPDVQSTQPGAGSRKHGYGIIRDCLTTPHVKISQLVTPFCQHLQAGIADSITFRY